MDADSRSRRRGIIADDHSVYRAGLQHVLSIALPRLDIVQVGSFDAAVDLLASDLYHIGMFDLDMPGMSGVATLRALREEYPALKIVVISALTDSTIIASAMASGVDAYISKTNNLPDITAEIARTIESGTAKQASLEPSTFVRPTTLTSRQRDVLRCVGQGMSNKEIGRSLSIAPGTVKIHLSSLFEHFEVRNRTELAVKANNFVS